jgi:hypothetical protein
MLGIAECCTPCPCPETETVNIPGVEGPAGTNGTDGQDGASAFTVTTDDFIIPPADGTTPVTVEVATTAWMAIGEPIFMPDGLFFLVDAIVDSTHVSVVYPAWEANVNAGNTISAGAIVTPSGWQPAAPTGSTTDAISKYGSGTAHTITGASFAAVTFGTSGAQEITLTTAGTWMLYARARVDYVAATFAAVRTVSLKLRRTNNTAGDVTAAASAFKTQIITTLTFTALELLIPVVQYVTALTTDVLQMQVAIDTDPTAGSIQIVEADLVAVYLHA